MTLIDIAGGAHAVRQDEPNEVAGSVHDTVDVFDAAAHLESMGFGGQVSVRRGYSNTFDHAGALVESRVAGAATATRVEKTTRRHALQVAWVHAAARSLTMLCGVLICIATVPVHHTGAVFAAGAVGWLAGQLVSSTMWQGLSSSGRCKAETNGAVLGAVVLALSALFCLFVGAWVPLLWSMWGCAISALVVIGSPVRLLGAVLPCALVIGLLLVVAPTAAVAVSTVIVIGFSLTSGCVVLKGTWVARGTLRESIRELVHPVLLWSAVQTTCLIVQLALLVGHVSSTFTLALSVAGLAAAAACEPVLDSALLGAKRRAVTTANWRQLRTHTAAIGVASVIAVGGVGLVTGVILLVAMHGTRAQAHLFLPAVLITALATVGSGIQLRTGNAFGAAAVAVGSLVTILVFLHVGLAAHLYLAALVLLVFVSAIAARRTSLSANW